MIRKVKVQWDITTKKPQRPLPETQQTRKSRAVLAKGTLICLICWWWEIRGWSLQEHDDQRVLESQNETDDVMWWFHSQFIWGTNISWKTHPHTHTPSNMQCSSIQFISVQFSCSVVSDTVNPWITARQTSLSITNSQRLLTLMSIESAMPSSHLILCCPLLLLAPSLPASWSFPLSELFSWGGQSIEVSASTSVLPMYTRD